MHREKAVGVSFRDGIMEVAFEQRTQRADASVDFDVIPTLHGRQYRRDPVLVECRVFTLKLGGNTDLYSP